MCVGPDPVEGHKSNHKHKTCTGAKRETDTVSENASSSLFSNIRSIVRIQHCHIQAISGSCSM